VARPTPPPPPPGCRDAGGKPITGVGQKNAKKKCSWAAEDPDARCGKHLSARIHCPRACNLCGRADCGGKKSVRNVGGTRRAKKSCAWVRDQWEDRCSKFPTARQQCKVTCYNPNGCEDKGGAVVETPGGPQTCAWVADDWTNRCFAHPTANADCPVPRRRPRRASRRYASSPQRAPRGRFPRDATSRKPPGRSRAAPAPATTCPGTSWIPTATTWATVNVNGSPRALGRAAPSATRPRRAAWPATRAERYRGRRFPRLAGHLQASTTISIGIISINITHHHAHPSSPLPLLS